MNANNEMIPVILVVCVILLLIGFVSCEFSKYDIEINSKCNVHGYKTGRIGGEYNTIEPGYIECCGKYINHSLENVCEIFER